jgi:hypothetical protein
MFALPLGLWWCWSTARGLHREAPINPVKVALFCFLGSMLCSYWWAMRRALPAVEASQADIGLLRVLVIVSVVLVCCDGIPTQERLVVLIRRMATAGGWLALLGILQFLSQRSLIDWISIPGFVPTQDFGLIVRSGFARPSATAMHPLEYAAALAVLFPVALTIALFDHRRPLLIRWTPAALIALILVLSGSRSGYLGMLIGVLVLALSWPRHLKLAVAAAGIGLLIVVFVTVPGMIGTIRGLFLSAGSDPSTLSRSGSYALVEDFFMRSPLFGRGFGTFLPTYRILDNQVLLLVVEAGLLGVLSFFSLVASAAMCAVRARRRMPQGLPRQLGQALCASTVAAVALAFFFDALGFPIASGTFLLAVGLCGAYWRLSFTSVSPESSVDPPHLVGRSVTGEALQLSGPHPGGR